MAPGELFLYSGGNASIHLRKDGSIVIKGNGSVTGSRLNRYNRLPSCGRIGKPPLRAVKPFFQ